MWWRVLTALLLVGCASVPDAALIGEQYLGARYVADPLGEGDGAIPDSDPLIRTDAFDCVTFVETALADGDVKKLTEIRYKNGTVDFLNRNHFIETDWLVNNADIVENASGDYAATAVRRVQIDKSGWLRQVHGIESDFSPQIAELEYIPYNNVSDVRVSQPVIVLFIAGKSEKSDIIGTDLGVVHMGFLLPGGVLRHASSQYGRVMDVDFAEYAAQRAKDKNNIGIMVVRIK